MTEKESYTWYETFVEGRELAAAREVLSKIDETIRIFSFANDCYTMDNLIENIDAFRQKIGDIILLTVRSNLEHDTRESKRVGTFPKFKDEPGISHLVWELNSKD